jgi:cytochrome P450
MATAALRPKPITKLTRQLTPCFRMRGLMATTTDRIDLDLFERGEVHEVFRTLRREAPVPWDTGAQRVLVAPHYDDVLFVSRHPELFSSAKGIGRPGLRDPDGTRNLNTQPGGVSIITMDPPRHVKMRRLVNRGFTPRAVNAMEPQIRQITNTILDRVDQRKQNKVDFVLDISSQLPLAVICGLMGIDEPD